MLLYKWAISSDTVSKVFEIRPSGFELEFAPKINLQSHHFISSFS